VFSGLNGITRIVSESAEDHVGLRDSRMIVMILEESDKRRPSLIDIAFVFLIPGFAKHRVPGFQSPRIFGDDFVEFLNRCGLGGFPTALQGLPIARAFKPEHQDTDDHDGNDAADDREPIFIDKFFCRRALHDIGDRRVHRLIGLGRLISLRLSFLIQRFGFSCCNLRRLGRPLGRLIPVFRFSFGHGEFRRRSISKFGSNQLAGQIDTQLLKTANRKLCSG
jgi:hypothetical protein